MRFSRRQLLRTGAAGLAGTAFVGTASANCDWGYELVGAAGVPGATDCELHDGWAFVANFEGITTYDLSDPSTPVFGDHLPGEFTTRDNRDVKVGVPSGDEYDRIAGIADNSSPGGVTLYDASDPANLEQLTFYDAEDSVHNHFIDGDYAYLEQSDRMEIVDITDPTDPKHVNMWSLREDYREDLAENTSNNLHDIYVQDDYIYLAYWDAGVIVLDGTDLENLRPVSNFAAWDEDAGNVQNAHYVQPTPDRRYTIVGAETFGTAPHGGFALYYTPALADKEPDQLSSLDPVAGEFDHQGGEPGTLPARADPYNPQPIDLVRAPNDTQNALRTAHNADMTNTLAFTSYYQGGIRAYEFANVREGDPNEGELREVATWDPEAGDAFWSAEDLESVAADDDERFYTVGSDIGKGLHVLELSQDDSGSLL